MQGFSAPVTGRGLSIPPPGVRRLVDTPAGGEAACRCPRRGLRSVVGQVPIEGGPADPEVLRYVLREMTIGLHGLGCREMLTSSALSAR